MKDFEKCTLIAIKYKCTSNQGNPSYWVRFKDSEGIYHQGCTASNASAGYSVSNYYAWKGAIYLKYHFTSAGSCIIDYIKHDSPKKMTEDEK
jgi:hypothetical protein